MEATEITDEADIIFSDSAAGRVAQLIKEEKNSGLRLRVISLVVAVPAFPMDLPLMKT